MSPHRDPETGKFVSGSGRLEWGDVEVVAGQINSTIPAADLSGSVTTEIVEGENAELVDFGNILDHDERFVPYSGRWVVTLMMPTTATAESAGYLSYILGQEESMTNTPPAQSSTHFGGPTEVEDGIADINRGSSEILPGWMVGVLTVETSVGDSTNGLGIGPEHDRERAWLDSLLGPVNGPVFDSADEVHVPHEFHVDNVSDHAIEALFRLNLFGEVLES